MNRMHFQRIAEVRAAEAGRLLEASLFDGAYYLAGYSVECALKACICKQFGHHDWPEKQFVQDCHSHDLVKMLRLASLKDEFDSFAKRNSELATNWSTVKDWSEQSRYEFHGPHKANALYEAVNRPSDGVLPWIKARW